MPFRLKKKALPATRFFPYFHLLYRQADESIVFIGINRFPRTQGNQIPTGQGPSVEKGQIIPVQGWTPFPAAGPAFYTVGPGSVGRLFHHPGQTLPTVQPLLSIPAFPEFEQLPIRSGAGHFAPDGFKGGWGLNLRQDVPEGLAREGFQIGRWPFKEIR
jgi:hypothetical protein